MKLKSNKSFAKRFRFTAKGKVRRHRAGASHKLEKKRTSSKRLMRGMLLTTGRNAKRVKRALPYG